MLQKSLVDARAAGDVAGDSVRRLKPTATAARSSERGNPYWWYQVLGIWMYTEKCSARSSE